MPKPYHRGDTIPAEDAAGMAASLRNALLVIENNMREQHYKDVVTGRIVDEIHELERVAKNA